MLKIFRASLATLVILTAQGIHAAGPNDSLLKARNGHVTKLVKKERSDTPLEKPNSAAFSLIKYPTKIGDMAAYLRTPELAKTKPQPAIIWLTGGFPVGGGSSSLWSAANRDNDQAATPYRDAGMVMMIPTLRGSAGNPGNQEGFYGEVDDVISAYDFLSKQPFVDKKRIYLGGHSTGGTLALLVATATDKFTGVISFGPVATPLSYGGSGLFHDTTDEFENSLRAPIDHLSRIKIPTLVLEGATGNADSLKVIEEACHNPLVRFRIVEDAGHFDILYPANKILAKELMRSRDAFFRLKKQTLVKSFVTYSKNQREASDLSTLSKLKGQGVDFNVKQELSYHFYTPDHTTRGKLIRTSIEIAS